MNITIAYISKAKNLKLLRQSVAKAKIVAIDTETTGLEYLTKKIRLIQIATATDCFVLDMFKLPKEPVKKIIEELLLDPTKVKIFHNAKFDLQFLHCDLGVTLRNLKNIFCTYVAIKLLRGGDYYQAGLGNVTRDYLNLSLDKSLQVSNWAGNIYKEQVVYSAVDAIVLIPLYQMFCRSILANSLHRAAKLEMECTAPLAQIEINGFHLDPDRWRVIAGGHEEELKQVEIELREFFGDINFNSNPQMWSALSQLTGLDVKSRSKPFIKELLENYQPVKDLFGKVNDYHPALNKYLEYMRVKKFLTSFGLDFLKYIDPSTGRIHPSFSQVVANTFRFTCSRPNLQQIPRDSEMRAAFTAPEGRKLITRDYSQIELRILAMYTQDALYLNAFETGEDMHTVMAAQQNEVAIEHVTPEMRQDIKPVNFGIPYGQGAPALSRILNIEVEEAKKRLRKYYSDHQDIVNWHSEQQSYFKQFRCVRTASGKLRQLTNWRTDEDEFKCIQASKNFPIQGTSADILKRALTRLHNETPEDWLTVNHVHDEITLETDEGDAEEASEVMNTIMVDSAEEFVEGIPTVTEGGVSDSWQK